MTNSLKNRKEHFGAWSAFLGKIFSKGATKTAGREVVKTGAKKGAKKSAFGKVLGPLAVGGGGFLLGKYFGGSDGSDQVSVQKHSIDNEIVVNMVAKVRAEMESNVSSVIDTQNYARIVVGEGATLECPVNISQQIRVNQKMASFLDQQAITEMTNKLVADVENMLKQVAEQKKLEGANPFDFLGKDKDQIIDQEGRIRNSFVTEMGAEINQVVRNSMQSDIDSYNNGEIVIGKGVSQKCGELLDRAFVQRDKLLEMLARPGLSAEQISAIERSLEAVNANIQNPGINIVQNAVIDNIMDNTVKGLVDLGMANDQNIKLKNDLSAAAFQASIDVIAIAIALILIVIVIMVVRKYFFKNKEAIPRSSTTSKWRNGGWLSWFSFWFIVIVFIFGGIALIAVGIWQITEADKLVPVAYLNYWGGPVMETQWDNGSVWKADQHLDGEELGDIELETGDIVEWRGTKYEVQEKGAPKTLDSRKSGAKWMILGGSIITVLGGYMLYSSHDTKESGYGRKRRSRRKN